MEERARSGARRASAFAARALEFRSRYLKVCRELMQGAGGAQPGHAIALCGRATATLRP